MNYFNNEETNNLSIDHNEENQITLLNTLNEKIENEEIKKKIEKMNEIKLRKYDEFLCKKCGMTPEIKFINNDKVNIICDCKNNNKCDVICFKNEYKYNAKEEEEKEKKGEEIVKRAICPIHDLIFDSYCHTCFKNICSDCLSTAEHFTHITKKYSVDQEKIEKIKNVIDEFEEYSIDNSKEVNSYTKEEDKNIIEIFKVIIQYYKYPKKFLEFIEFPCQNLICNIENAYAFLNNFKEHKNKEKSYLSNENLNEINKIITLRRELNNTINYDEIREINIESQNFNDLSFFEGKDFRNLKLLKLEENNIRDISSLIKIKSKNLEVLNLNRNKIDNKVINHIKEFSKVFPKLEVLSLYSNYITDYDIFNEISSNIKELKKLYIGSNNFDKKTIDKINKNLIFKQLFIVGFTNGVTSDNTVNKLFSHLEFKKINRIYLSGNNLNSLEFSEYIKDYQTLEVLWLPDNNLKEYESLSKYKLENLTNLNLANNNIDNINNLEKFINSHKKLEIINLSGNNKIDLYDSNNKKIIERINKIERIKLII